MKNHLRATLLLSLLLTASPPPASAALRGVWDFLTNGSAFNVGLLNGCEQPALRPGVTAPTAGHAEVEYWFAFSTRSTVIGKETSRSIWLGRNLDQAGFRVTDILDARRPLLRDPAAAISYTDPAWSPDGKYLAYVKTDPVITHAAIYVQEYQNSMDPTEAATPVGAPLLVAASTLGVLNRSPAWSPAGDAIAYASNGAGPSTDIWTVPIDPAAGTVGTAARATMDDFRSELTPSWGPDNQIVYITNRYGPGQMEIVDLDDGSVRLADPNFRDVSHRNPSWSPDGASIYCDAPQDEEPGTNSDIWKLDLATASKCDVYLDTRGDADPDVSRLTNFTVEGTPYNLFLMSSQAANFGVGIWRGSGVGCASALPIGVDISPSTLNLGSQGKSLIVTVTMPPETQALGYRAQVDVADHGGGIPAGFEGVKNRNTIIVSPTFLDLTAPESAVNGSIYGAVDNFRRSGEYGFEMKMDRKTIEARLVALGLVDQEVPCRVTAYSNLRGRQFSGYAYLRLTSKGVGGQAVRIAQNVPNPFNPVTKIRYAVAKPGQVALSVYNVRGELVAILDSGYRAAGWHEATWDGSTRRGHAPSGVYFAKAVTRGATGAEAASDVVKMVLAK
jgi:hypothetical protein